MGRPAQAALAHIVFDKFHVLRHLSDALDEVRRSEYRRLAGQDRTFIKGQRYTAGRTSLATAVTV